MTPLQKIKEGILTNNLQLITEGYNALSTDTIQPKKIVLPDDNDDFQRSVNTRRRTRPVNTNFDENEDKSDCRIEPFQVKKRRNHFADDHRHKLPDYSDKDKLLDMSNRETERAPRRDPYRPAEINCYVCGRKYKVNPTFIYDGKYRCGKCNAN